MKKIAIAIALACSLISCVNSSTKLFWRDANWDVKLDNSFVFKRNIKEDSINVYSRNNEKLCIGTKKIDSVEYFFYKNNLMKVVVYFTESLISTPYFNYCRNVGLKPHHLRSGT